VGGFRAVLPEVAGSWSHWHSRRRSTWGGRTRSRRCWRRSGCEGGRGEGRSGQGIGRGVGSGGSLPETHTELPTTSPSPIIQASSRASSFLAGMPVHDKTRGGAAAIAGATAAINGLSERR